MRPNEGKKGQNQDKRDEKDYLAKFRNTFSLVYVSLGNSLDSPATPIQLGQLYPSTVFPGLLQSKILTEHYITKAIAVQSKS